MTREEQIELMKECYNDATIFCAWSQDCCDSDLYVVAAAFFQYRAALVDLQIGRVRSKSIIVDKQKEAYIKVLEYRLQELSKPKTKEDGGK